MEAIKALQLASFQDIQLSILSSQLTSSRTSLLTKVFTKKKFTSTQTQHQLIFSQIHHNYILVCSDYKIHLFYYDIDMQERVNFVLCQQIGYNDIIHKLCNNKNQIGYGNLKTYVVIATQTDIDLYILDQKSRKLQKKSSQSMNSIQVLNFFNQNSLFLITKKHQIFKFDCSKSKIIHKDKNPIKFKQMHNQQIQGIIKKSFLFGEITQQSQDRFYYLFVTQVLLQENQFKNYFQSVYVKQFWKRNDKIQQGSLYLVKKIQTQGSPIFTNLRVTKFKESFFLQIQQEIYIVKKKYNNYYFYDNIRKKHDQNILRVQQDGTLCSVSDKVLELSKIIVGEPRSIIKIIDAIYFQDHFEPKGSYKFVDFQIYKLNKLNNYAIFFQNKKQKYHLKFSYLKKVKCQTKLLDLIQRKNIKIEIVQQLAKNLQIQKKEFYLRLYQISKQQFQDIQKKLLESQAVSEIKKEVKYFLKRRKIPIYDLLKIYIKLNQIIQNHLKNRLQQKLLRQYLKCNFFVRKLKIQPDMNKKIGFQQFKQIKNKGIVDYICQIISKQFQFDSRTINQKQKKSDAKYLSKNQSIIKDLLTQFKIILLQDYQLVVQKIINKFSPHINLIFNKFPILLPKYPYNFQFKTALRAIQTNQTINQKQVIQQQVVYNQNVKTFLPIRQNQWMRQLSCETLTKNLSEYHLTSAVQSMIDSIINNSWTKKTKLIKHGFIVSSREIYIKKGLNLSGINIFLKVCELGNLCNYKRHEGQKVPLQLVKGFLNNNVSQNLNTQEIKKCSFYVLLHFFLLQNNLGVGKKLSINKLLILPSDELISLFFLGKRRKCELIFNQFRQLYKNQQGNVSVDQFNNAIQIFVSSENCSPVQINLLISCVQKMKRKFQEQNQQLINIIIDGFCSKLQVRQESRIQELIKSIQPIFLSQELNEKMIVILKISQLTGLFKHFRLEKKTIRQIEKQGIKVLLLLLQNYFSGNIESDEIDLENIRISLDCPRNMLNILIYLQQKLYGYIEMKTVLKIYSRTLIDQQIFDVIVQIIYEQQILQQLNIDVSLFTKQLVQQTLYDLYNDNKPFSQIKNHLYSILNLQKQITHPSYNNQLSKIRLLQIVSQYDPQVLPIQIFTIPDGHSFIIQFIKLAFQILTINKILELYACLKVKIMQAQILLGDEQFFQYLHIFGRMLIMHNYLDRCLEVVIFCVQRRNEKNNFYSLVSQFFLKSITQKYSNKQSIGKRLIEYYVINFDDTQNILRLLYQHQNQQNIIYFQLQRQSFQVHPQLLFIQRKPLTLKFQTVQSSLDKKFRYSPNFYYHYFFALIILYKPDNGFDFHYLFQNYEELYLIIDRISEGIKRCQQQQQIPNFCQYEIKKRYFSGLWKVALIKTDNNEQNEDKKVQEQSKQKKNETRLKIDLQKSIQQQVLYMNVINQLKIKQQKQIIKCLTKCSRYLYQNKLIFYNKLKKIQAQYNKNNQDIHIQNSSPKQSNHQPIQSSLPKIPTHRTMTLKDYLLFYQQTVNVTINNPTINQKQIMSMIWQNGIQSNKQLQQKNNTKQKLNQLSSIRRVQSYNRILAQHQKQQNLQLQKYFEMFDTRSQGIQNIEYHDLQIYLRHYYYSERQMIYILDFLQQYQIGVQKNIKIAKKAGRIYASQIDLKQLFDYDFYFYQPQLNKLNKICDGIDDEEARSVDANYYRCIFDYLTPNLKRLMNRQNVLYLSKIIKMGLKYDQIYEYKVYLLGIQKLLQNKDEMNVKQNESSLQEYLSKIIVSLKFMLRVIQYILQKCINKQVKIFLIFKINQILQNYYKKAGLNPYQQENYHLLSLRLQQQYKQLQ